MFYPKSHYVKKHHKIILDLMENWGDIMKNKRIKIGDFVTRNSYGNDILFNIEKIFKLSNGKEIATLKGVTYRIKADAPIEDLCLVKKKVALDEINKYDCEIFKKAQKIQCKEQNKRIKAQTKTGIILHLDGDKKYSQKSLAYYKKLGLQAIVKNIPENKQAKVVYRMLEYYNPDILVITGHDGMIKLQTGYNDLYNYRNSKHFIETIKEARRYDEKHKKDLVIFAGACQSYFEALISAGANFASSPARILIEFLDPLIVAKNVATTENYKYLTIDDIADELKDGKRGVGGLGAYGKKSIIFI